MAARANEEQFNELHGLLTKELLSRISNGLATTQDLKVAADWLSKNNITGLATAGSPLSALFDSLEIEMEDLERVIR